MQIQPAGNALKGYNFSAHKQFYSNFKKLIHSTKTKGIVVGYPLLKNNQISLHCKFVQNFIKHMQENCNFKTPVTLVDQGFSTIDAKYELLLHSSSTHVPVEINPKIALSRKRLFDKFAAKIILQRYLDFLHSQDQIIKSIDKYMEDLSEPQEALINSSLEQKNNIFGTPQVIFKENS